MAKVDPLYSLALSVFEAFKTAGKTFATAESCTGGMIAASITDIPGSSEVFDRGFVTYSNLAKSEMLGVDPALIERHGAVSSQVALAMALGALTHSQADMAVSVTGVAGPGGGSIQKPVGTVWIGINAKGSGAGTYHCQFTGDRAEVRRQSTEYALRLLLQWIDARG